jgi:hypothetical protein
MKRLSTLQGHITSQTGTERVPISNSGFASGIPASEGFSHAKTSIGNLNACILIAFVCLCSFTAQGQTNGDYRSRQNGNWNSSNTWQKFTTSWNNASDYPGQNSGAGEVTIQNGHTVSITSSITNGIGSLVVGVAGSSSPDEGALGGGGHGGCPARGELDRRARHGGGRGGVVRGGAAAAPGDGENESDTQDALHPVMVPSGGASAWSPPGAPRAQRKQDRRFRGTGGHEHVGSQRSMGDRPRS